MHYTSGLLQWQLAQLAEMSESRLSRIGRRGVASQEERKRLSRLLGVSEEELFGPGPAVSLRPEYMTGGREALDRREDGTGGGASSALRRTVRGS